MLRIILAAALAVFLVTAAVAQECDGSIDLIRQFPSKYTPLL